MDATAIGTQKRATAGDAVPGLDASPPRIAVALPCGQAIDL